MITSRAAQQNAPAAASDATATLIADLRNIFGLRLLSIVSYGPHVQGAARVPATCLALVDSIGVSDLEACAGFTSRWHRAGLATPLLLTPAEFRSSLDAFPLEYGAIVRAHVRVFGDDPFEGVTIRREDLRRACETQIKSHLLHMREGFLEAGGRPSAVADLVARSAPAFTAVLRHVAWLNAECVAGHAEATREGAREAGLDESIVNDLLTIEQGGSMPSADPARLFPRYLATVEQLARAIDAWRL
jgi:hypothetical protein